MYKVFDRELNYIKDEKIRELTVKALQKVDEQFYEAPASSTGKYHPVYSLGKGGLVRHVKAAVYFFVTIIALEQYQVEFTDEEIDCGVSALILHDTCKSGLNWDSKYTVHEHPVLVVDLLDYNELDLDETEYWKYINILISSHMGEWNTNNRSTTVLPKPTTEMGKLVHLCDYLASRKQISGIDIFEESELSEVPAERQIEDWKDEPATAKQAKFIRKLLDKGLDNEKLTEEYVADIRTKLKNDEIKKGIASQLIDKLIKETEEN